MDLEAAATALEAAAHERGLAWPEGSGLALNS